LESTFRMAAVGKKKERDRTCTSLATRKRGRMAPHVNKVFREEAQSVSSEKGHERGAKDLRRRSTAKWRGCDVTNKGDNNAIADP